MRKIKRYLFVFMAVVILSNAVICDYEGAKKEAQAAEVVAILGLDFLIDLAITALASYGIYVTADTLINDTDFINDFFDNALNPENWTVKASSDEDLRIRLDNWCYTKTGYRINWAQIDSDLNEVKEGIGGWLVNTGKRQTELLSQLADSVFNNKKLPDDPKWKKDMKTWIRAGLIGFAAVQALNSLGDAINKGSVDMPGYTEDWYLDYVEGNDVIMPDADGTIHFLRGEDSFVLKECPSDLNLIKVTSRYYWGNNQLIEYGNYRTYLIGVSKSNKGVIGIFGNRNYPLYTTKDNLYCYGILEDGGEDMKVQAPHYKAASTVDQFLETYSLKAKQDMSYDDWLAQQKEFQSDLIDRINELDLTLDELVDMLDEITDVITDPDIDPIDKPGLIDPIVDPEPEIPSNPDDPVIPTPTPEPVPVDPDDPEIEPGQIKQVEWTQFFPFCLVVDFVECIKLFKAAPRNPVFRIPFKYDKLGVDEEIVIDLTDYEKVWEVARTGQVVLFIVALIILTKKFFF